MAAIEWFSIMFGIVTGLFAVSCIVYLIVLIVSAIRHRKNRKKMAIMDEAGRLLNAVDWRDVPSHTAIEATGAALRGDWLTMIRLLSPYEPTWEQETAH